MFGDVPFGYFKNDPADTVFSQAVVTTICTGAHAVLGEGGTFIIKMGDANADMWRESLTQAGFTVRRDRTVIIGRPPFVKVKGFLGSGRPVCVGWFHMTAHKGKLENQYENPVQYGTEERGKESDEGERGGKVLIMSVCLSEFLINN